MWAFCSFYAPYHFDSENFIHLPSNPQRAATVAL